MSIKISRRNLFLQFGAQLSALVVAPSMSSAELPFKSFQIVLSDITTMTPPEALLALLEPFVKAGVPISCIVTPESGTETFRPDSVLADYLRRFIADYPARIEVILETPALTGRPYYFQSRLATQARQAMKDGLLAPQSGDQLALSLLTLANFGTTMTYEPGGVRAAGFRSVLTLPRSGIVPVESRWDHGVLHIFGGMHFGLTEPVESIQTALTASVRDDPRSLLILSTSGLTSENTAPAVARMTEIASLISEHARAGRIVPTTPTDYHVRASPYPDTVIGLRVDVQGTPDEPINASALELIHWLQAHDIAFTVARDEPPTKKENGTDICPQEGQGEAGRQDHCSIAKDADSGQQGEPLLQPKVAIVKFPEIDPINGVDHQATLHPPRIAFVGEENSSIQVVSDIKTLEDTVLILDQRSYSSVAQRLKTTAIIRMLDRRSSFRITDVNSFVDQVQPRDSIRLVYQQTEDVMYREHSALAAKEPLDRDLLLRDAKLAWRFFKKFTNPETGLIPSTVFLSEGSVTFYNYATMWDIGSQIFGMIAAVELDLMTVSELNNWAKPLIENLSTVTIQGLQLPSSIVHVGNKEKPDQAFNSCDVGRLLNAFHRLRTFSPALKDTIERKVAGWDIQETVHKGRMHDLTPRLSYDRFISHCTDYAAKGYAAFGIVADSPYAPLDGQADADSLIELLFSAAKIGSLGAEPLLLEGVELGFTPTSKYLADMLFSAQLEDNRKTGTMRCVSESPLDRAPWFVYQGYNINNFAKPWNIEVNSNEARYKRPDFMRSIEVISVKAAYLWVATHPHAYHHTLVDYVRARARIENFGFSAGVYLETGLPMANYTDLNTNGIILEAATYMLD